MRFGGDYTDMATVAGECRSVDARFDPNTVWVARTVQASFCEYHDATPDEAIANIRLVMERAMKKQNVAADWAGYQTLRWNGFEVKLTPDLQAVIQYQTSHHERTPQMVAEGLPTRFPRRGSLRRARYRETQQARAREAIASRRLSIGQDVDCVVDKVVNFGVFVRWTDLNGLIHVSELPPALLSDGRPKVETGHELRARVVAVDLERGRIDLSALACALSGLAA
jgi:hypothetical protein